MKKLKYLFIVLLLVGCSRAKEPNSERGKDYTFDIADYIVITEYGENEDGYIEVVPKDITLNDFDSEEEYIAVKHDLDLINPLFRNGRSSSSAMKISKTEGLKNGDIITISFNVKQDKLQSNINIEEYEYQVSGLQVSEEIDLFGNDTVTFFTTTQGNVLYRKKNNNTLPPEFIENLQYIIHFTGNAEVDKTILSVEAKLNDDFLNENNYSSTSIYLAKHNLKAKLTTEKVLTMMVEPIDFSSATSSAIENTLYEELSEIETDLTKICNLQQLERQKVSEPYTYYITYFNTTEDNREYYRRPVMLFCVEGEYFIQNIGNRETTKEDFATQAFDGAEIKLNFMMGDEKV